METLVTILVIGAVISTLIVLGAVRVSSDESRKEEAEARRKAAK